MKRGKGGKEEKKPKTTVRAKKSDEHIGLTERLLRQDGDYTPPKKRPMFTGLHFK